MTHEAMQSYPGFVGRRAQTVQGVLAREHAARLEKLATGTTEWRVANPVTGTFCIAFDYSLTVNPQREAHEWLADHRRRFPNSEFAGYEVSEVVRYSELEKAALSACDFLNSLAVPTSQDEPKRGKE